MEIEYCGHSYFVIRAKGVTIAVDPHDGGSINVPTCRIQADYILVTHEHYDHNAVEVAGGREARIYSQRLGEFRLGEIPVKGVKVYHDKSKGKLRGWVAAYIIDAGDLRLAHMGDLGEIPEESIEEFKGLEVIFLPVGGVYTIDAYEAWGLVEELRPRIVVPMHYWIKGSTLPLDPLDRFLNIARAPRIIIETGRTTLSRGELPEKTSIMVFRYPPRAA
ncbi:MAG: MBL fold metallo-hydrolase [Desulfurococcales archaeon]|nr:MBL fold metallo-hydrolase [Desulfurococcales archaeon]